MEAGWSQLFHNLCLGAAKVRWSGLHVWILHRMRSHGSAFMMEHYIAGDIVTESFKQADPLMKECIVPFR
jgi:hypothetical protein